MTNKKYSLFSNNSLPRFNKSVSLLCWAYNEEDLIEDFVRRINTLLNETIASYEIIVVDDCSNDNTNGILTRLKAEIPQLVVMRNHRNMNVGYSCKKAIEAAKNDYLFWQTVDWSYNIIMLRTFLELFKQYDVVAGVRRTPVNAKGKLQKALQALFQLFGIKYLTKRSDTITKAIVSVTNYCLIRSLFRMPLSDYQNVVFYPTRMVQDFEYRSNSSFLNPEILINSYYNGAKIVEVPISFIPRSAGKGKGTKLNSIKNSITDIFKYWILTKPLRKASGSVGYVHRINAEEWEIL